MTVAAAHRFFVGDSLRDHAAAVNVDRIVHQSHEIAVFHGQRAGIARHMDAVIPSVRNKPPGRGIRQIIDPPEGQIMAELRKTAETAAGMHRDVLKCHIPAFFAENSSVDTEIMAQNKNISDLRADRITECETVQIFSDFFQCLYKLFAKQRLFR